MKSKIYFIAVLSFCSQFHILSGNEVQNSLSHQTENINLEADVHISKFLQIADDAWAEVLKEKIKEYIIKESKKTDEFAKLVAEANYNRWKKKSKENDFDAMFNILKTYIEESKAQEN